MLELRGPDRNLSREVGGGRKEKYALPPPPLKVVKTVFLDRMLPSYTVVGDYINTMMKTFYFNFDLQHGCT